MRTNFLKRVVVLAIVIAGFVIFLEMFISPCNKAEHGDRIKNIELSDEILSYILDLRIENAYLVYAQARLESANFTSVIFKENNNLFGMKFPERRPTTAIGVNRGHAVYKDWRHSVIDYALMQAAYYRGLNRKEYLDKVMPVYSTDSTYRKILEGMIDD